MKKIIIYIFILLAFSPVSKAQLYSITDSCSVLIIKNITTSRSLTYPKNQIYADTVQNQLNLRTLGGTIIASWTNTQVSNLPAASIQSGYAKINYFLSYTCVHSTGQNKGGGGGSNPDTLYITSGNYLPDTSNTTNVAGANFYYSSWTQIDSIISVDGEIDIKARSSGSVVFYLTLPVPVSTYPFLSLSGLFNLYSSTNGGAILEGVNNTAQFTYTASDTGLSIIKYHFQYVNTNMLPGKIVTVYTGDTLWARTGSNLYPYHLSDSVGIGTAIPQATLDVSGNFQSLYVDDSGRNTVLSNGTDPTGQGFLGQTLIHQNSDGSLTGLLSGEGLFGNTTGIILGTFDLNSHAATFEGHKDSATNSFYAQMGASRSNDTIAQIRARDSVGLDIFSGIGSAQNHLFVNSPLTAVSAVKIKSAPGHVGLQIVDGTQAAGYVLTSDASGNASWQAAGGGSGWSITGNTGTDPSVNFIGTIDNEPIIIRSNNIIMGVLDGNAGGNILLGNAASGSSTENIAIGNGASVAPQYAVGIGNSAQVGNMNIGGVALGYNAHAVHSGSVALGPNALDDNPNQFAISPLVTTIYMAGAANTNGSVLKDDGSGHFNSADMSYALPTYTTPTLAHAALGSGVTYILNTTIGVTGVLLLAVSP